MCGGTWFLRARYERRWSLQCAHRNVSVYPLAEVELKVGEVQITVEAAVSETLTMSVLLGTDVPELEEVLHGGSLEALAVVTWGQEERQRHKEATQLQRQRASKELPEPPAAG